MDETTSRLIGVYNEIDGWLRTSLGASGEPSFVALVERAANQLTGFRRHAAFLKKIAAMRNFLVHEHKHPHPLAAATPHSVEHLTHIRDQLLSPPLLLDRSNRPVTLCCPTAPIGLAAKLMHDGSFSQLPVYRDGSFVGLLTAETVARWLASHLAAGQEIVEEQAVAEVLNHQEDAENYCFMGRAATVPEGLSAFERFQQNGKRLEAILITHSGRPTDSPLGIVTVHDIPRLNQAIAV